jgi:hypothetical protein
VLCALPSGRSAQRKELRSGPNPSPNNLPTLAVEILWRLGDSARWAARLTQIALGPVGLGQLRRQGPLGASFPWLMLDYNFAPSMAQKSNYQYIQEENNEY